MGSESFLDILATAYSWLGLWVAFSNRHGGSSDHVANDVARGVFSHPFVAHALISRVLGSTGSALDVSLDLWATLLSNLESREFKDAHGDALEPIALHLRMVAELYGFLGRRVHQLTVLSILVRLNDLRVRNQISPSGIPVVLVFCLVF